MSEKQLIYKEKALEILDDFQSDIENCIPYAYSNARIRMAGLYPRSEWIPCSERLPNNDEEVIVSIADDGADNILRYTTTAWRYGDIWVSDNERIGCVMAWMPLPKPYEEGEK